MKYLFLFALMWAGSAQAACRYQWVDHDFNASTPAVRKQVCDNTFDPPAINRPSVRPIQRPQVKPIVPPSVPPIGTTNCRTASVYNENTRQWETRRVCR